MRANRSPSPGFGPRPLLAHDAVVFDFDGTLIDSREIKTGNYVRAFAQVFSSTAEERPRVVASCVRTSGANRFVQLHDTLEALGRSAELAQEEEWSARYSRLNAESVGRMPEFPSVRRLLADLRGFGYRLYAASGILQEELERDLRRRGLATFFREIRGGDKPGFLRELLGRGFAGVLFVGDTPYDRTAAEEAGVPFFMVESDRDLQALGAALMRSGAPPQSR